MTNRKRKLSVENDVIKKKKNNSSETFDSNSLILPPKSKSKIVKTSKEPTKLLSKKERKNLEKIMKTKEEKSTIRDVYAELAQFDELKPKDAIKSLADEIKAQGQIVRKTLSSKVKPVSKRKYKQWEVRKDDQFKESKDISPDTSDFSSDNESVDVLDDKTFVEKINVEDKIIHSSLVKEIQNEVIKCVEHIKKDIIKSTPKTFVMVNRPIDVQDARLELPILAEETTIMEALDDNDVIIISGSTGCGKTTQVPQFLYEAGYTNNNYKIGITEPRRIAAISVSERVKYELACQNSDLVSYHVRYQNASTCGTKIKFMTDGVLLQEQKNDYLLKNYSAIIIDEAHERSIYTDVLIALLSFIVRARRKTYNKAIEMANGDQINCRPLKLIIMSATMRVDDFAKNRRLFPGDKRPPVIELSSRQFKVQVQHSTHTRSNYLEEAFKMIYKVHNEYDCGGILVFVTGQQDCLTLCKWLKKAFPVTTKFVDSITKEDSATEEKLKKSNIQNGAKDPELLKVNLNDFSIIPADEESELNELVTENDVKNDETYESDEEDSINFGDILNGTYTNPNCINPVFALPLFSLLDKEKQDLVFKDPPTGQRLVVISTNVAETSLTIPNIKYVIDSGMEKVKKWDKTTGISKFTLERISKSSAEQRKGRAGRTGPGFCFRLYSQPVFEELKPFSLPEILQRPVEDVVLLLRNYIHSSIPIQEFCLPTVPSEIAINMAEKMLISLGALRRIKRGSRILSEITDLGRTMNQIPLSPRFAKMLLLSNQQNLIPYAVLIASLLSVPDFFIMKTFNLDEKTDMNFKADSVKKKSYLMLGDITVLLAAFCKLEIIHLRSEEEAKRSAEERGIRWKAFIEVKKLRQQLTDILTANVKNLDLSISVLSSPSDEQFDQLRQLLLSGSSHNVAVIAPPNISLNKNYNQRRKEKCMYMACNVENPVFIHQQSVLSRDKFKWVIYQDIYENVLHGETSAKAFMRNLTVIEPEWLTLFCTLNCSVEGLYLDNKQDSETKPIYDEKYDKIMAHAKQIYYGPRRLEIPSGIRIPVIYEIMENEETQTDQLQRWFARFFLEGIIFKAMAPWRIKIKSICKPELLLSPFANSRSEIMSILRDIRQLEFPSKKAIRAKWDTDSKFLLDSYLDWLKPDERDDVIAAWPPVDLK